MANDRISQLAELAARIHANDRDQQGAPYLQHILAVANTVTGEQEKAVALMHDALEDHRDRFHEIERNLATIEFCAVILLTRRNGDSYDEYIERIATWPGRVGEIARTVKLADLRHNLGRLTPELGRLRGRYERAIARLGG